MKTLAGFVLCALLFTALAYGNAVSMTADGFPIQGYLGACIPAVFVLIGVAMGMILFNRE